MRRAVPGSRAGDAPRRRGNGVGHADSWFAGARDAAAVHPPAERGRADVGLWEQRGPADHRRGVHAVVLPRRAGDGLRVAMLGS